MVRRPYLLAVLTLSIATSLSLFQNCGSGFKVAEDLSGSGNVVISGTPTPTPGATPTPISTPPLFDNVWSGISPTGAPTGRCEQAATAVDGKLFLFGGISVASGGTTSMAPDSYFYDLASSQWSTGPTFNAPGPRNFASAISTGTSIIVWGGSYQADLNDGGVLGSGTIGWSAVSNTGAPSPRHSHLAVWTGSKMIVYGGANGTGTGEVFLNTGGIYDPTLKIWTTMGTIGAPTTSGIRSGVWTGSKLIVWGGAHGNQGGIYDPATDTWAQMNSNGAPSARNNHGVFWTGTEVLVWGGTIKTDGKTFLLTTGALYNPATDTWRSVAQASAPPGAVDNSMAFNGSRLVVYESRLKDNNNMDVVRGGIYDLATDSWSAMNTAGAPSSRYNQTTLWIGDRMIVWGGCYQPTPSTISSHNSGFTFK